jgi:UDP-2,4-diacetamido-2,4,6-trideoxy-beta-L-altropyranose hydrolase
MARIVFRCDASAAIGGGHVARCMALAHALKSRGAAVELVTRALPDRVRELHVDDVVERVHDLATGSAVRPVADEGQPLAHADWLPASQTADAAQTVEALASGPRAHWLVVDHYALDARWERAVRPHVARILTIDDLADRTHACDALLDQNFFLEPEQRYDGLVPRDAERMLGPHYALLRSEFAAARDGLRERDGAVSRIFVCFGGFDGACQTVRALQAIEAANLDGVAVDVVVASDHPERSWIERYCAGHDARIHFDAANVAALMARADLAIGAGGIMNWERAALGLAAIVATVAENQHAIARDLAQERACIYLGLAHEWHADTLAAWLRALRGTPSIVRALAARASALTDGKGAARVAARLLPEPVTLRRASAGDCDAIHAWRNAGETRRYSGDSNVIPIEQHRAWFARVVEDEKVALLVGEREGSPVGVLRYDVGGARAVVSVYVVPGLHGRGLGPALLRAGTAWMLEHYPDVTELRAEVRHDNAASIQAFAAAGYTMQSSIYTLELTHG